MAQANRLAGLVAPECERSSGSTRNHRGGRLRSALRHTKGPGLAEAGLSRGDWRMQEGSEGRQGAHQAGL